MVLHAYRVQGCSTVVLQLWQYFGLSLKRPSCTSPFTGCAVMHTIHDLFVSFGAITIIIIPSC